jgi:hypothetical protein
MYKLSWLFLGTGCITYALKRLILQAEEGPSCNCIGLDSGCWAAMHGDSDGGAAANTVRLCVFAY